MAFTKVVGAGIHTLSNITSHNINSSGIITATKFVGPIEGDITAVDATFTGNVSIAKTLTYEDVANVDSVGIVTARQGIQIPNDTYKLRAGTELEMQVWHDGTNSVIKDTRNSGKVRIQADNFDIRDKDDSQTMIAAGVDGSVSLSHSGNQKIQTTSHGISVTGIGTFSDAVRIVKSSGPLLELTTNTGAADATLRLSEGTPGSTTNGGGMFYSGADNKLHITCGTDLTTKRITITRDNGIVGINSSEPSGAQLVIKNSDDSNLNAISIFNDNGNMSSSLSQDSSGAGSYLQKDNAGTIKTFIRSYNSSYFMGGNIGIGTVSPTEKLEVNGNFVVAESIAVNRPRIVLSAPNEGSSNYRHLFGANLKVDSSATFTTPTQNISGGGWQYLSANSLNAHGTLTYISAPDTNSTASAPVTRLTITPDGDVGVNVTPTNNDMAGVKPRLHVLGISTAGQFNTVARFQSGTDNNDSGAAVVINHSNDRGLLIQGGRGGNADGVHHANSGLARFSIIHNDGSFHKFMEAWGDNGQHIENISLYTGNEVEALHINSDGKIGVGTSNPTRSMSIEGDINLASGSKIESYSSGGNLQIQGGSTYPGGHIKLYGGSGDDMITFNTTGASTSSTERLRLTDDGKLFLHGTGATGANNTSALLPAGHTFSIHGTTSNDGISVVRYSGSYGAYGVNIGRSKNDTFGTNTAVSSGDELGHVTFYGADGTNFDYAAQITGLCDGAVGTGGDATDMPGALSFRTTPEGSDTPVERMRIRSGGTVAINESSGGILELTRTTTNTSGLCGKIVFGNKDWDSSMASIQSYQDGANDDANLKFYTQVSAAGGEQERVGITSDGNVQIGTATNPGNTLRYLDVANFNTGSNAGSILRLLTKNSNNTGSATADIVKYKAGGLEFLNYENVGTTGYISFKTAQNNGSPVEQLRIKPDAGIDLPTANYEFTQNNFRSKTVESIGNNNPASATGAMTSVEGSRHSWNNTGGICDLPDYKRSDWTILEVYGKVNPNSGGSGGYSDPFHMLIYQGYGWNGSALTSYIYHEFLGTPSNIRDKFPSGTGNTGYSGLEVKWYDGSSESSSCAHNSTTHYLRIKLATGSFNTTYGCFASVRIFKRF